MRLCEKELSRALPKMRKYVISLLKRKFWYSKIVNYLCLMINKKNITNVLKANKLDLLARYHLKSIGIFGSFTREDFKDDSDIDILIDYEQPIGIEFIDLAEELEKILNLKVDLVSKNGIKPKYLEEIQKDLVYV